MNNLKKVFNPEKLSTFVFYSTILTFIIAFNFSDHGGGGWQQQYMPFLNNRPLADIIFLDSLTGYAVTGDGNFSGSDTDYVLKTTNAGDNWNIIFSKLYDFQKVMFLNIDTGYILHGDEILRTTNAGDNWNNIFVPPDNFGIYDMFPISYDTMWISYPSIGGDFIYRTTNSGAIWTKQFQGNGLKRIYIYSKNIGFVGSNSVDVLLKTTNSGSNWFPIIGENGFTDIYFIDSLTGWKCSVDNMKKTTDGGITWNLQNLPSSSNITNFMINFSNTSSDTIWGTGGYITYSGVGIQNRGIIYRTTNSGLNWKYQVPDTSFRIANFKFINFINMQIGWAYSFFKEGIYTDIGGDTTFYTHIFEKNIIEKKNFVLKQNYPNPFNPKTKIGYELKISSIASIKIFDILGKELTLLINKKQSAGKYEIEFDGSSLSSGIYLYSLVIDNYTIDTKRMIILK